MTDLPEATALRAPRFGLAVLSLLHAPLYVLVAFNAGWRWSFAIGVPCLALALLHLATAGLSLMGSRYLPALWRTAAWGSLLLFLGFSWMLLRTAVFVGTLYEGLGLGIAAALGAVWGLVVLVTLPFTLWAFAAVGPFGPERKLSQLVRDRRAVAVALIVCGLMLASLLLTRRAAQGSSVPSAIEPSARALATSGAGGALQAAQTAGFDRSATRCAAPLDFEQPTAFVLAQGKPGVCIQQATQAAFAQQLELELEQAKAHGPVSVDVVVRQAALHEGDLFDSLKLRPGLDGVCSATSCALPWQLLISDAFSQHQPVPFLKDVRFGISLETLAEQLGDPRAETLVRITTQHLLFTPGGPATELRRLRPVVHPVDDQTLKSAALAAEQHVLAAQLPNGTFRYTLDPNTGKSESKGYSLARQAGTTLALCESNTGSPSDAVRAALQALLEDRKDAGDLSFLQAPDDRRVRLASNTLPLAAFVACRSLVGAQFDPFIVASTRFLLEMQRADGGFLPYFDTKKRRPRAGPEPLFAPGQAILALALLLDVPPALGIEGLPARDLLQQAAVRAMDYVAHQHWDHPLYDVFFIEENWHCIAARAAQHGIANRAYEQFCFDYIAFRSQAMLDAAQGTVADFDGGMGVGHVVPPHNTGTAGFAEALAAAISVKQTRGLDVTLDQAVLRRALGYLMRQQWTPANALFSASPAVVGGFSAHPHQMVIRIDFVQHAWSALSHGRVALSQSASGS